MNNIIQRRREGRVPSALVKDAKSRKPKRVIGFKETNSEGVPINKYNNSGTERNTRQTYPELRKTRKGNGYRINGTKLNNRKSANKRTAKVLKFNTIQAAYNRSQKNTSSAAKYGLDQSMPEEVSLPNLVASRMGSRYFDQNYEKMELSKLNSLDIQELKKARQIFTHYMPTISNAKTKIARVNELLPQRIQESYDEE